MLTLSEEQLAAIQRRIREQSRKVNGKSGLNALQDAPEAPRLRSEQKNASFSVRPPDKRQKPQKVAKLAKANIPTEHEEQAAVITWWSSYSKLIGVDERLLFAIPNGANKSMAQAAKFKREGLRKGVPDLMLAIPSHSFHGLFIELKRKGEKGRPEQIEYCDLLRRTGYNAIIALGADEAIRAIKGYLG